MRRCRGETENERDEREYAEARAKCGPTTDGVPMFLPPLPFTPTEQAELLAVREAIKHGYQEEAAFLAKLATGWRFTGDDTGLPAPS